MASVLLWRALGICPGDVVVFTGGREKTALALRVAEELVAEGRPPVCAGTGGPAGMPPAQVAALEQRGDWVVLVADGASQGENPAPDLVVPVDGQPTLEGCPGDPLRGLQALPPGARVVPALTLAGGAGRRFGGNKLLHPWAGSTVLEASLRAPLRVGLKEVVVVTGAYHRELAPLLARYSVRVVPNPGWPEGMASSLRAGIQALMEAGPPRGGGLPRRHALAPPGGGDGTGPGLGPDPGPGGRPGGGRRPAEPGALRPGPPLPSPSRSGGQGRPVGGPALPGGDGPGPFFR